MSTLPNDSNNNNNDTIAFDTSIASEANDNTNAIPNKDIIGGIASSNDTKDNDNDVVKASQQLLGLGNQSTLMKTQQDNNMVSIKTEIFITYNILSFSHIVKLYIFNLQTTNEIFMYSRGLLYTGPYFQTLKMVL